MPASSNASRSFAFLPHTRNLCRDLTVLELGAGGALPSTIATLFGASQVVVTDYPNALLINDIWFNTSENVLTALQACVAVKEYRMPNHYEGFCLMGTPDSTLTFYPI